MNKSAKIILGILTFLPLVCGIGSLIFGIYQIVSIIYLQKPTMPFMLLPYFGYVIPYLFILFVIYVGLGIFYLVHIIQNKSIDNEKRILWIIVLIILNGISMPVYWYVHIWGVEKSNPTELNPDFNNSYE